MTLNTRRPTGKVAFPFLLLEGEEKSGKSHALASLTASPRVGRSFLLDLGDGSLDEYATLGDYELLEHSGTWGSVLEQVTEAAKVPSDPAKPNVIGVDAGTLLWGLQKSKAESRARGSKKARALLAADPDADIDVTMPYWNEVKDEWARLCQILKKFPGIGVITAQGKQVTKVDAAGQPTRDTEWSVEVEKTTPSWVSAWVRLTRDPRQARLIGVRSLHVSVPTGGLVLPQENMLDHLVFDMLGSGGFGPNTATMPTLGIPSPQAKARVLAAVKRHTSEFTDEAAKAAAAKLWSEAGLEGKREVTEAELTWAMPATDTGARMKEPEAHQAAQDDSGEAAAPETAKPPSEAPAATEGPRGHVCPDGTALLLEGKPVTAEQATTYLNGLKKPALVNLASQVGVGTAGRVPDILLRLFEAWGLLEAPFDPPSDASTPEAASTEGDPSRPDSAEDPSGPAADELPMVDDVPEGWVEGRCLCGQPLTYDPGLYTSTIRHLDSTLDQDHDPEEPF